MSAKIVLLGRVADYQENFNLLNIEIEKGTLTIVAAILADAKVTALDGIPICRSLESIVNVKYDYLIALNNDVKLTKQLLQNYGLKTRVIPIRVFNIPYFDFGKYERLLLNTPSIIARHCWGGLLFHRLGLEFNSPFVNLFLTEQDFIKLASNFKFYMNQDPIYLKDGYEPNLRRNYPIAKLYDITLYFNHYVSFEEAYSTWKKRKERLNWGNLLFETTAETEKLALQFDALPLQHKLCFCACDVESPNVIDFSTYLNNYEKGTLGMVANGTATGQIPFFNILELLNDFNYTSRNEMVSRGGRDNNKSTDIKSFRKDVEMFESYKKSKFYALEYRRFAKEDNEVKWELDDKIEAYNFVEKYHIKHPDVIAKLDDIHQLKELKSNKKLPNRFVVKISNRAACVGIMLLRKIDRDKYFDDLSLKAYTLDEIIENQLRIDATKRNVLRSTYWFIEELTQNFDITKSIPFDYKVYCINGVPKLIVQISRNVNHYTVAVFDGTFMPLREGVDWFVNPERAVGGVPVIPPSAYKILTQSIRLAKNADKKFVRIDWFDDGKEPVFGEFTFCSGLTFVYTFSLSKEIVAEFDKCLDVEDFNDYSTKGYFIDSKKLYQTIGNIENVTVPEYKELIKKAIDGNYEAMAQLAVLFEKLSSLEVDISKKRLLQHFSMAWEEIGIQYNPINTERILRRVRAGWGFVKGKSIAFQSRVLEACNALLLRAQKSDWYKVRLAQFQLDFVDRFEIREDAKNLILKYAEKGNEYAKVVKEKYLTN